MSQYTRYFKVTTGPMIDAVLSARAVNKEAHREYLKILEDIGAKDTYYQQYHKLVSILFDEKPGSKLYKRVHGGWYPKQNSKQGRELHKRFNQVKSVPINSCLETVGLPDGPTIFSAGQVYWPMLVEIPSATPVCFVKVPWLDISHEELEEYKKNKAAGKCFDGTMDALLWEASDEMVEVKEWQFLKEIDEWNDSVRDKSSA